MRFVPGGLSGEAGSRLRQGAPPPRFVASRGYAGGAWDRDLPLEETLSDGSDFARSLGFGDGSSIYRLSLIYGRPDAAGASGSALSRSSTRVAALLSATTARRRWRPHLHARHRAANPLRRPGGARPLTRPHRGVHVHRRIHGRGEGGIDRRPLRRRGEFLRQPGIPPYSVAVGSPCRVIGRVVAVVDGSFRLEYRASLGARFQTGVTRRVVVATSGLARNVRASKLGRNGAVLVGDRPASL